MSTHTPRRVRRSVVLGTSALGIVAGGIVGSLALATPAAAATAATVAATSPARVTTQISIRVSRATTNAYDPVAVYGQVFAGTGHAVMTGETVALQQLASTGWRTIGWARATSSGYANFRVAPTAAVTYRLFYTGYAPYASSSSTTAHIAVNPVTRASRVVALAASRTGAWYRYGGAGPTSFDCSGLTQWTFRQVGVALPHNADAQKRYGRAIPAAQARPGDLIIFVSGGYGYHAGVYAGGGYMYDAPHAGATVGKHKVWSPNVMFRRLV